MNLSNSKHDLFPSVDLADEDGFLCLGGDLSLNTLMTAYSHGIFPWFNPNEPIQWWSPNPRMILETTELIVSKSMRKLFKNNAFKVTYNVCFKDVIEHCRKIKRNQQNGTWIDHRMIHAYNALHHADLAISVEVWLDRELVGGLYGVNLGTMFCGESMFSKVANASKYGFIALLQDSIYTFDTVDCQIYSKHLASLGAREIPRSAFIEKIPKTHWNS